MQTRLPEKLKKHPHILKYKRIKWTQFATFLGIMAVALLIFGNYPGGRDSVVLVEIFSLATMILFIYHIYRLTQYPMLIETSIVEIEEEKLPWVRDKDVPENNYHGHKYKIAIDQTTANAYCLQGYVFGKENAFELSEDVLCISFAGDLYILKKSELY